MEDPFATKLIQKIQNFYKSELHRMFEKYPYIHPLEATDIHSQYEQRCIDAYENVLNTKMSEKSRRHLTKLLLTEFASFKETNSFKVGSVYENIHDTIQLFFQKYSQQIKETSKSTQDFTDLAKLSEALSINKIDAFEKQIQDSVSHEPISGHKKTLQYLIDKVWKVYERENARKSKILEPPKPDRNSVIMPTENPVQFRMPEPVHNTIPKPNRMSTLEPYPSPITPRIITTPPTPTTPPGHLNYPNCMAYLISSRYISCATFINNEFTPIFNHNGKTKVKFVIGEKNGTLSLDGMAENMREKWYPGKDLETLRSESNYDITLQGSLSSVKIEFFIAFALAALKSQAEEKTQRKFDQSIICVPAYYSSTQRYRVESASLVAGFCSSQIITDITAAAYHFGLTLKQTLAAFVVVKETNEELQPAIFVFEKETSKLEMTVNRVSSKKFDWDIMGKTKRDGNAKSRAVVDDMMSQYGKKHKVGLEKNLDVSQSEDHKKLLICDSKGWDTVFKGMNITGSVIQNASICLEGAIKFVGKPVTVVEKSYHHFYTARVAQGKITDNFLNCSKMKMHKGEFEVDLYPGNTLVIQIISQTVHQKIGELLLLEEVKAGACCAVFKLEHGMLKYTHSFWRSKHPTKNIEECLTWKQNYKMSKSKIEKYQNLLCQVGNSTGH